jgi:Helicase conserved C-terminal domain
MADSDLMHASGTAEASRFQCDLYRYWRAVHAAGSLALNKRQYLTRAALRHVQGQLGQGAPAVSDWATAGELGDPRLFFARRLLERLGLLRRIDGPRLAAAPPDAARKLFALSLAERLRVCARMWVGGGWWPDHLDARQEPPDAYVPAPPRVVVARRRALQVLLDTPVGSAVVLPARPHDPWLPASRPQAAGASGPAGAPDLDDDTFRALAGPLCWLGFVAPAGGEPDRPGGLDLRITRAAWALRPQNAASARPALHEASGKIVVQANLEILALPPLSAPTLLALDSCAELQDENQVARYRLTRMAFAGARQVGWDAEGIIARLERMSGNPLPQNVQVTLQDWERQTGRIRMHQEVALLEVDRARVLDDLLADREARTWVERRLSPRRALLSERYVTAARKWLVRHGELPAVRPPMADEMGAPTSDPPA